MATFPSYKCLANKMWLAPFFFATFVNLLNRAHGDCLRQYKDFLSRQTLFWFLYVSRPEEISISASSRLPFRKAFTKYSWANLDWPLRITKLCVQFGYRSKCLLVVNSIRLSEFLYNQVLNLSTLLLALYFIASIHLRPTVFFPSSLLVLMSHSFPKPKFLPKH